MSRADIFQKIVDQLKKQGVDVDAILRDKTTRSLTIEAIKQMYESGELQRLALENGMPVEKALVAMLAELGLSATEFEQAIKYILGLSPVPPSFLE